MLNINKMSEIELDELDQEIQKKRGELIKIQENERRIKSSFNFSINKSAFQNMLGKSQLSYCDFRLILSKDKISSHFQSVDNSLLGVVTITNDFDITFKKEYFIDIMSEDLTKLTKLINPLDNDLHVSVEKDDYQCKIDINDGNSNLFLKVASHQNHIFKNVKEPNYGLSIEVAPGFSKTFINKHKTMNFSSAKISNEKITLSDYHYSDYQYSVTFPHGGKGKIEQDLTFSATHLSKVLSINKSETGILGISEKGLAVLKYKGENMKSHYYFVALVR